MEIKEVKPINRNWQILITDKELIFIHDALYNMIKVQGSCTYGEYSKLLDVIDTAVGKI